MDLDSLWMVHWEDRRNVEIGSHTGVSDWMSILCCVARMSRLPELPDTACLKYFRDVGRKCVLDLNVEGTCARVSPPECGLETVAQMPLFQHGRVAVVPSDMVAQVSGCTRMRGCAGNRHSPGETQDALEVGVSPGEMKCVEDSDYIRPDSVVESPVYVWSVTGSLLFGSPLRRVRGLQQPSSPPRDPTLIVLVGFWLSCRLVWWSIMSSRMKLPVVDWAEAATTTSTALPDLRSDRLHDLVNDISDVMGLWALQPSAAIVKVMSVPESYVNIGFHEILIHDLEEELPLWQCANWDAFA